MRFVNCRKYGEFLPKNIKFLAVHDPVKVSCAAPPVGQQAAAGAAAGGGGAPTVVGQCWRSHVLRDSGRQTSRQVRSEGAARAAPGAALLPAPAGIVRRIWGLCCLRPGP